MITKVEAKAIPGCKKKDNPVERDIIEFVKSGWEACEVKYSQNTMTSAYSAYYSASKRLKLGTKVLMRGDKLFLARV